MSWKQKFGVLQEHHFVCFLGHFDGLVGSADSLHEMFFDEVEVVTAGVEPEDGHLVAPFVDSSLMDGGDCPEIFGNELHLYLFMDFLPPPLQLFHKLAAKLSWVSFADVRGARVKRVADRH